MGTVKLSLNGREISADSARTILEVARAQGVDIPTLCHDTRLPPYGSCLVCVVELRNAGKLVMSCATPVAEGMEVWTESAPAKEARKKALEMLLSTHYADCRGPCFLQCPAQVDVQGYLAMASAGMYAEALDLIRETNPLPSACGRVCVRYCEANCRRKDVDAPAAVNFMKRYISDLEYGRLPAPVPAALTGKRVAVIGGGPAGLSCAFYLRRKGVAVTLFDQQPKLGGMLRYGIPEYRLPQAVLDREIHHILAEGIDVRLEQKLGRDFTLDSLKAEGYDAIFLGLGSWVAKAMDIPEEQHPRVLPGIVFLEGVKKDGPPVLCGTVAIVGGGNTAIDAARTALRCGAENVTVLYRRTRTEMPADDIEVEDALEEGIDFQFLIAPKRVVAEGERLLGIECDRMELGAPDASGRRRPVVVPGSAFLFRADWIVSAIGQEQDLSGLVNQRLGEIKRTKWNSIDADPETLMTSVAGVFAGGDVMTGPAAAIDAIGSGRRAAVVIGQYLESGEVHKFQAGFMSRKESLAPLDPSFYAGIEKQERGDMPKLDPQERARSWEEVDLGVSPEQAHHEAHRCLSCGCSSVFDCDLKVMSGNYDAKQEQYRGRVKKHQLDARHPHILLDSNKCILCGRCVRYCGDLIGVHALGFVNRGFETVVKPVLDKPLAETSCIGCGNCIEVCPTGAITFKATLDQPGPFRTVPARSVCAFCGVGCSLDVNHVGRSYFFVTAKPEDPYTEGELCAGGRFGTYFLGDKARLYSPFLKGRGAVGMPSAAEALAVGLKRFKGEEILFLASPRTSMETAFLFTQLAKAAGSRFVFTAEDFQRAALPLAVASTTDREAVARATVLLTVGQEALRKSPVLAFQVRRAVQKGAALVHLGEGDRDWLRLAAAHVPCEPGGEAALLERLCGILAPTDGDGPTVAYPEDRRPFQEAARLLQKGELVVVAGADVDAGDRREVAWALRLAELQDGTCLVPRRESNGQGWEHLLQAVGLRETDAFMAAKTAVKHGLIKAVVALGTDVSALVADLKPAFSAVIDLFPTAASESADVVVPLCPVQEEAGSLVAFDGTVQAFKPVFKPLAGFDNVAFLSEVMARLGGEAMDLAGVRQAIVRLLPTYAPLAAGAEEASVRTEQPIIPEASARAQTVGAYAGFTTFSRRAMAKK